MLTTCCLWNDETPLLKCASWIERMQVCETMLPSFIVDSDLVSPRNPLDDCTAVGFSWCQGGRFVFWVGGGEGLMPGPRRIHRTLSCPVLSAVGPIRHCRATPPRTSILPYTTIPWPYPPPLYHVFNPFFAASFLRLRTWSDPSLCLFLSVFVGWLDCITLCSAKWPH